ncbi:helix-turn-helix domain-containing protein [Pseudomonas aeruginosa]
MTARQQAIFTLDELAAYLKVGKRTLYRLASHGEIPVFKVGGTWRFRQSEIERWINGVRTKSWTTLGVVHVFV